ncbi:uncharacterized protein AMSG_04640 [Thecamonas trahens ATCC 50062]|uniref:Uncharacterized protein n=1 Tax=Thecamonas trahens ATCC 50062 TaxID=461836 RepID=A0A0L0D9X7_THETB|nr:hypothetical protein AMSG_04640 [Thecamonas trahens ATCC 50062]KNC48896.1 hypothetical protein AMSG_04640 [Thecamonas trahens ATCC 50062]|eukprot:XP_013758314.1 hypothetical protein AMSG_04640 [Thecamonas trahens ATCC 50062]
MEALQTRKRRREELGPSATPSAGSSPSPRTSSQASPSHPAAARPVKRACLLPQWKPGSVARAAVAASPRATAAKVRVLVGEAVDEVLAIGETVVLPETSAGRGAAGATGGPVLGLAWAPLEPVVVAAVAPGGLDPPDAPMSAAASAGAELQLWRVGAVSASGAESLAWEATVTVGGGPVRVLAFCPCSAGPGRLGVLATAGSDGRVRLYVLPTGLTGEAALEPLVEIAVDGVAFTCVAWSAASLSLALLALGGTDGRIYVYQIQSLSEAAAAEPLVVLPGHAQAVMDLDWAPLQSPGLVAARSFRSGAPLLASAGWDGAVKVWSLAAPLEAAAVVQLSSVPIRTMHWLPVVPPKASGGRGAAAVADESIATLRTQMRLKDTFLSGAGRHFVPGMAAQLSEASSLGMASPLLVGIENGSVLLVHLDFSAKNWSRQYKHDAALAELAVSDDGLVMALADFRGRTATVAGATAESARGCVAHHAIASIVDTASNSVRLVTGAAVARLSVPLPPTPISVAESAKSVAFAPTDPDQLGEPLAGHMLASGLGAGLLVIQWLALP